LTVLHVGCVGGSWITPSDVPAAHDWARITKLATPRQGSDTSAEPNLTHEITGLAGVQAGSGRSPDLAAEKSNQMHSTVLPRTSAS
jgi:hypothetical protein